MIELPSAEHAFVLCVLVMAFVGLFVSVATLAFLACEALADEFQ